MGVMGSTGKVNLESFMHTSFCFVHTDTTIQQKRVLGKHKFRKSSTMFLSLLQNRKPYKMQLNA